MIEDLDDNRLPHSLEADVCVIGAGAAGITVALLLARRGIDVVLLESGGERHETAIHDLNRCSFAARPFGGAIDGRFRALGGSTTRWGGQILPMQPIDFEARSWINASGWPIAYSDLVPAYKTALGLVGLDGCIERDADVWQSIGQRTPQFAGGELVPYFTRFCPEPDLSRVHGAEIRRRPNLRCILHATVTALKAEGGQILGATARNLAGRNVNVRSRRFVLCVGGIETPRLLLHPLDDGAHPPWTAFHLIGRFLQDHPGITCANIVPARPRDLHRLFDNVVHGRTRYQPRLRLTDEVQRRLRLLQASCLIIFQSVRGDTLSRARAAAKELLSGRTSRKALQELIRSGPLTARLAWRTYIRHRAFNLDDLGFRLGMQLEQQPDPESRVTLSDELDSMGLRRAQIDWRISTTEIQTVAVVAELIKRELETSGIAKVSIDADVAGRSSDVATRMIDQNHHSGTARMGATPNEGVVDRELRVFGTSNLYVCSSAVFPTGSFSNPTHTIIALGIRLAEKLCSAGRDE
jgi:choline dehydrogenase-like flavoprotein